MPSIIGFVAIRAHVYSRACTEMGKINNYYSSINYTKYHQTTARRPQKHSKLQEGACPLQTPLVAMHCQPKYLYIYSACYTHENDDHRECFYTLVSVVTPSLILLVK